MDLLISLKLLTMNFIVEGRASSEYLQDLKKPLYGKIANLLDDGSLPKERPERMVMRWPM